MDREMEKELLDKFNDLFGSDEDVRYARGPGRVNLIGEHTDYNGGFVLPMAIDHEVRILFKPRRKGPVRLWSANYEEWDEFQLDDIRRDEKREWTNYIRGVACVMLEAGFNLRPIDGIVYGDIPTGAGLSSSAALEVATAMALCPDSASVEFDRGNAALLCQKAENEFVGVNCGIMDQFVSLHADTKHALLLDCRSLAYDLLPLNTDRIRVVVCNTMVKHKLGDSAYNRRRSTCEKAADILAGHEDGVEQLRDVSMSQLDRCRDFLDEVAYRRARHVISENERTQKAARSLKREDYGEFGRLMYESHRSLRDDYEVSCEELDIMVELARGHEGVFGARMTGGGFGGCTVNLVESDHVDSFVSHIARGYEEETGIRPDIYDFTAAKGASAGMLWR
jgi:galactokinase